MSDLANTAERRGDKPANGTGVTKGSTGNNRRGNRLPATSDAGSY